MTTPPSPQPSAGIKRKKRKPFDWSTAFILTLTCAAAVLVYFRDGPDRFFEILQHDLRLFGDMLIKVAAGCLLGAFLARLLPRELVSRWIGAESGFVGLVVATVLGAIIPGGPLTIYPVAAALLMVGADVGATIAFITSWTLMGFTRELVSRWIGAESGFVGLVVATVLGAIIPGGPLTIYPVAAALLMVGADVGATIAFITSWTLMGFTRALVWEVPFFGTEFVFWRLLFSVPLPIVAGLTARLIVTRLKPDWGRTG